MILVVVLVVVGKVGWVDLMGLGLMVEVGMVDGNEEAL